MENRYIAALDPDGFLGREKTTRAIYVLAFATAYQAEFGTPWMSMEDLTLPLGGLAGYKNKAVIEEVRELLVAGFLESDLLGAGYRVCDMEAVMEWAKADPTRAKLLDELTIPPVPGNNWTVIQYWLDVITKEQK